MHPASRQFGSVLGVFLASLVWGCSRGDDETGPAPDSGNLETGDPEDTGGDTGDTEDTGGDSGGDTGPDDTGGDTGDPATCFDVDLVADDIATWVQDGAPDATDGLSGGQALLARRNGVDWDLVVHGRSATLPFPEDTDGAVAIYVGLGPPSAYLYSPPEEAELELIAVGDVLGGAGDEVIAGVEHPGLLGARVAVHSGDFESRSVLDAEALLTSESVGANPLVAVGDVDGDGAADLLTSWLEGVERWAGPMATGSMAAGDGDELAAGKVRQWMTVGDVDGDGHGDVLAATPESGVVVLLGSAVGLSSSVSEPDHAIVLDEEPGADVLGIAVGDLEGDGSAELLITVEAQSGADAAAWVLSSPDDAAPTGLVTGETGRYSAVFADLDGDGGDEVVLGRFRYSAASGGLLVWDSLDGTPMRIDGSEPTATLFGAALGPGVDLDGTGRELLPVVDSWGAGEWRARAFLLDPCQ